MSGACRRYFPSKRPLTHDMDYSLNALKGVKKGIIYGSIAGLIKGSLKLNCDYI